MLCLDINKQPIYYATRTGASEVTDDSGQYTGEYQLSYSTPVLARMNVSSARGSAELTFQGIDIRYSKLMVTDDMSCPISEDTVLWIGADPATEKYNYVVRRVARSLNYITYAIDTEI